MKQRECLSLEETEIDRQMNIFGEKTEEKRGSESRVAVFIRTPQEGLKNNSFC